MEQFHEAATPDVALLQRGGEDGVAALFGDAAIFEERFEDDAHCLENCRGQHLREPGTGKETPRIYRGSVGETLRLIGKGKHVVEIS